MFVLTSPSSVFPSRSVEERANTRDRSALAVKIGAVIYYGQVETYVERACAGGRECMRAREREDTLRERLIEILCATEGERERGSLLLCAALLPGWEVSSIERTRVRPALSARRSLLLTDGKTQ